MQLSNRRASRPRADEARKPTRTYERGQTWDAEDRAYRGGRRTKDRGDSSFHLDVGIEGNNNTSVRRAMAGGPDADLIAEAHVALAHAFAVP